MKDKRTFPDGFYWGAATASYQVEGGIENCDWAEAGRKGRVPVCGDACDHYNRFEEDFKIAKELGHNALRISIEWARIEPKEGEFDMREIEHYKMVLKSLHEKELMPFVTLWHFTLPQWFADKGGFEHKDSPEIFARYCEFVVKELGQYCRHWATINEPVVYTNNSYLRKFWPPFKRSIFLYNKVFSNLVKAHKEAYKKIKDIDIACEVAIVKDNFYWHSNWNPFNMIIASFMGWWWNRRFLNKVYQYTDTIGLNYYFHKKFGDTAQYEKSDMGWDLYPEGIYHALRELKQYGKPLFVAEAGIADEKDVYRADYVKNLVYWTHYAIERGADIRGFLYWSLLDNYEWAHGFEKRFGLVEIEYKTKERKVRESAWEYKKVCQSNGIMQ